MEKSYPKVEGRTTIGLRLRRWKSSSSSLNIMYIPAFLLFALFIYYPFLKGVSISFTNWDGYSQMSRFIGLDNYKRLLTDRRVGTVIYNTLVYGIGSTLLQNILGLAYALMLNSFIRGKTMVRTIVYLPVIISPLIMGYIWYFFFQYRNGALNDIILLFRDKPLNLLADTNLNVWIITLVNTYQFMGVAMIIFLAGLQSISKEYYEAAEMDGASGFSRFRNITLPLLAPAITVNVVLNLIGGLKLFDVITALTNGGPGYASASLSTMVYQLYFAHQDAGYAATLGNFMFLMISAIGLTSLYYLRKKEISL